MYFLRFIPAAQEIAFRDEEREHWPLHLRSAFKLTKAAVWLKVNERQKQRLVCWDSGVVSVLMHTPPPQNKGLRTDDVSFLNRCHFDCMLLKAFQRFFRETHCHLAFCRSRSALVRFIPAVSALLWHCADARLCCLKHLLDGGKPLNIALLNNRCVFSIIGDAEKKAFISSAEYLLAPNTHYKGLLLFGCRWLYKMQERCVST